MRKSTGSFHVNGRLLKKYEWETGREIMGAFGWVAASAFVKSRPKGLAVSQSQSQK
jgi:hypothetical protein